MKCFKCCDELDLEELENPYKDDNDNIICDDCHFYDYEMICPLCEDAFDIRDFKTDKNVWIIVHKNDCDDGTVKPGLYSGKYDDFNYDEYITGFGYLPEDRDIRFVKEYSSSKIEYTRFICFDCGENIIRGEE